MSGHHYQLKGSLWIEDNQEPILGPGRVELLERIGSSGSIRQAALQMGMSYAQAWKHIEDMNTHLNEPVVISHRGGKGGGRAELTLKGKAVIEEFKSFYTLFQTFLQEHTPNIKL